MVRTMPRPLLTLIVAMLVPSVASAEWYAHGLSGRHVVRLRADGPRLYACSDLGLWRKATDPSDTTWTLIGFATRRVHDMLALSPDTLLAAREISGSGADTVALWRSTDAGATWDPFQNGFARAGSAAGYDGRVHRLLAIPGVPEGILAASPAWLEKSTDGGGHWKFVRNNASFYFIAAGLGASPTLWTGGETFVFTPFLYRSTNQGDTWTSCPVSNGIEDGAGAVAFDPDHPATVFSNPYGLRKSEDNGATWTFVNPANPPPIAFQLLANRSYGPLRLYNAGSGYNGAGVTLYYSDDGGLTWGSYSYPATSNGGVFALLLDSRPTYDLFYLGTGNGVYSYRENNVAGVRTDPSALDFRVSPSPAHWEATIAYTLAADAPVRVQVVDLAGRMVATLVDEERPAGPGRLTWSTAGRRTGIYFCVLETGGTRLVRKLTVLR